MNSLKTALLAVLLAAGAVLAVAWVRAARRAPGARRPTPVELLIGFVTNFFDTLGIGSFAPTTAIFKLLGIVPDELIPGTLIVGHSSSVLLQSLIFITAVAVAPALLVAMIAASAVGSWFGAGIVARLTRRTIQMAMGVALLIAGTVFAAVNLQLLPGGGDALGLEGWRFALAVGLCVPLGALMTVGIGMYAPTMIMLALFGMHPLAAFPVMMGSCAMLQPVAGVRFLRSGRLAWGPALGLTLGGCVGVCVAAFIVKSLPLATLRWLVVVVVLYAALSMLRSVFGPRPVSPPP